MSVTIRVDKRRKLFYDQTDLVYKIILIIQGEA